MSEATYIGGHPTASERTDGILVAVEDGGFAFIHVSYANMLRRDATVIQVAGTDLLAASVGRPGSLKGALGGILPVGGDFDAGFGVIFRGKTAVAIAVRVDGARHLLAFSTEDAQKADAFLMSVQQRRAAAGLASLLTIEGEGAHHAAAEQATTLSDIRDLLLGQQALLERIAARIDRLP
jgi:hypothetical protein